MDYLNRTTGTVVAQEEKKIFFDETRNAFNPAGIKYEESADVADLYKPVQGTQKSAFGGARVIPGPGYSEHPLPPVGLKTKQDPVDIDDDVSDHGPDSIVQQLRELDGMNRYMNNVRVPTSNKSL